MGLYMAAYRDAIDKQRQVLRELLDQIESMRYRRREQWRDRPHPEGKRFSQEELTETVCPTYKNLLKGTSLRLPSRPTVLAIAEYLECTIHETNDLLLAAQYLPEVVELRADEEQAALERARNLIHSLPIPALIPTQGLHIDAANTAMLHVNGFSSFDDIPSQKRDAVHWFFDPNLASYRAHARDTTTWQINVRQMLHLYRYINEPFAREPLVS